MIIFGYLVLILFAKPLLNNCRKSFTIFMVIIGIVVQTIIVINLQAGGKNGVDDF